MIHKKSVAMKRISLFIRLKFLKILGEALELLCLIMWSKIQYHELWSQVTNQFRCFDLNWWFSITLMWLRQRRWNMRFKELEVFKRIEFERLHKKELTIKETKLNLLKEQKVLSKFRIKVRILKWIMWNLDFRKSKNLFEKSRQNAPTLINLKT